MERLGESSKVQDSSDLTAPSLCFGAETAATQEDEQARSTAKALAAILVSSAQANLPRDLVEYLRKYDSPQQDHHKTLCILHKTRSINDSEVKIIADYDCVVTPQRLQEDGGDGFMIQKADQSKRAPHILEEQWIAGRFLTSDILQPLREEKLLPLQVAHFSFPLKRSRWAITAALVQYLFLAAHGKDFVKEQLPKFIRGLWRMGNSDSTEFWTRKTANTTELKSSSFGGVKVTWAFSGDGQSSKRVIFHGAALRQNFELVLDTSSEDYRALYPEEMEPFAGEMGVAFETFLSAEQHLRRRAARSEQHRMEVLIRRFNDKVECVREQAKTIWELKGVSKRIPSAAAAGASGAFIPDASGSGKNAKKNRKEKERKARKKRDGKAHGPAPKAGNISADVGSEETQEVEMYGTDGIASLSAGNFGSQRIGVAESAPQNDFVQAGESSYTDINPGDIGDNGAISQMAVGWSRADTEEKTEPPRLSATDIAEDCVEEDGVHELVKVWAPFTSLSKDFLQPIISGFTAGRADHSSGRQNPFTSPVTKPDTTRTQPQQERQITIPSSPSTAARCPSTTTRSNTTISRTLMTPAVPFNLRFLKKETSVMQQGPFDMQRSAIEGFRPLEMPEDPEAEQQSRPSDSPQQTATGIAIETSVSPQKSAPERAIQPSAGPQLPVPEQESHSPETRQLLAETPHSYTIKQSTTHQESQHRDTQQGSAMQQESHASDTQRNSTGTHLIQFDTLDWPCRNPECRKLTSPYDGSTVICPRCGPYSKIRYCGKKCVFDDAFMHWSVECGKHTLTEKAEPLTIEARQINIQPFIPSLTHYDRPERHRQMLRHSLDTTADYFIFSDFVDWRADGFPSQWPATKHASGDLLVALNFALNGSVVPANHVFARLLRICFLVGVVRTDMTYFLFKMIQGRLYELGLATEDVKNCLVWQFKHEFGFGGGFADLLLDQQPVNWPLVAGKIAQLEARYGSFLSGRAGLGKEWTNEV